MPRFTDSWVVDKVMYTYVNNNGGASCLCCGAGTTGGIVGQRLFLFSDGSGFEGVVNAMSDLETQDDVDHEIHAANLSPWPSELRDRIWTDRLSLRFKMKRERKVYRAFFEKVLADEYANDPYPNDGNAVKNENNASLSSSSQHDINIQNAISILHKFCRHELSPTQLHQIFQPLSPSSLVEMVKRKYKIGPAFSVVLGAVEDQVVNFKITGYGTDAAAFYRQSDSSSKGRNSKDDEDDKSNCSEEEFEKQLEFKKGFYLNIAMQIDHDRDVDSEQWFVNDKVLVMFLRHMTSLASRTALLSRTKRRNSCQVGNSDTVDGERIVESNRISCSINSNKRSFVPSFRSDRRVIRLLIARYWADRLIEKYNEVHS
jgi:hypothetical protein